MGEYEQPVIGMKDCFHVGGDGWQDSDWSGREWFVVNKAEMFLSEGNVLVPHVEMGVEAREQVLDADGKVDDAPISSPDHPLVRYARQFTENFDLIAERRSVVYHLRELAKASFLAKFMLHHNSDLAAVWFDLVDWQSVKDAVMNSCLEIPQLWNDRSRSTIRVQDGSIVNPQTSGRVHSVYGGVQFGLDRFDLPLARNITSQVYGLPNLRMAAPSTVMPAGLMARAAGSISRYLKPLGLEQISSGAAMVAMDAVSQEALQPPGYPVAAPTAEQRAAAAPAAQVAIAAGPTAAPVARVGALAYPKRSRAPAIAPTGFRVAAPALSDPRRPRGVDLGLDGVDIGAPTPLEADRGACAMGDAFWRMVDGAEGGEDEDDMAVLMKDVFNPRLSDRRLEGDGFAPPATRSSYLRKLRRLVQEEARIRQDRLRHFVTGGFATEDPGPLFPPSWVSRINISSWQVPCHLDPDAYDTDVALEDLAEDGVVFDRATEEGLRFRIYRQGQLEIRTTQEHGRAERIGVVFSRESKFQAAIWGPESVTKVALCVSHSQNTSIPEEEGLAKEEQRPSSHYFLLLRSKSGGVIVTSCVPQGQVPWEECPKDLEARLADSKVLGTADTSQAGLTVQDFRAYASAHTAAVQNNPVAPSVCKRYAQSAYNWARRAAGHIPSAFLQWEVSGAAQQEQDHCNAEPTGHITQEVGGRAAEEERQGRLALLFQASDVLKEDREVAVAALRRDGLTLARAPASICDDEAAVGAAVQANGLALEHASARLRDSRDVVLAAVKRAGSALKFASEALRCDKEVVSAAVVQDPFALAHAAEALRADPEVALAAVLRNGFCWRFALPKALFDREAMLAAVGRAEDALESAPQELLSDPEFMLAAFEQNGAALKFLGSRLRADRAFILEVVKRNGFALRFASEDVRSDPEVVAAALRQDARAAKYAQRKRFLLLPAEARSLLPPPGSLEQTPVICSRGHELAQLLAPQEGNFFCDRCERRIPQRQTFWGCAAECCFDLCLECNLRLEVSGPQGAAVRAWRGGLSQVSFGASVAFHVVGSWDGEQKLAPLRPRAGAEQDGEEEEGMCWASVQVPPAPVPRVFCCRVVESKDQATDLALPPQEMCAPAGCTELRLGCDPRNAQRVTWEARGLFGAMPQLPLGGGSIPKFALLGSWDNFGELHRLVPAGDAAFHAHVMVRAAPGVEEFQVVVDGDRSQRYGPTKASGEAVAELGCEGAARWRVGLPRGCRWLRVVWLPADDRCRLTWSCLGEAGENIEEDRRSRVAVRR